MTKKFLIFLSIVSFFLIFSGLTMVSNASMGKGPAHRDANQGTPQSQVNVGQGSYGGAADKKSLPMGYNDSYRDKAATSDMDMPKQLHSYYNSKDKGIEGATNPKESHETVGPMRSDGNTISKGGHGNQQSQSMDRSEGMYGPKGTQGMSIHQ